VTSRRRPPSVIALVAARNEEATIARTVKSLLSIEKVGSVVVVADGCIDATVDEALGAGATVLAKSRRLGKGDALEDVLDRVPQAAVYLLVDGDVADTASETSKLLDEVVGGKLDAAIGRLPALEGGGFGNVKRLAAWLIQFGTGFEADAPLSGQRALTSAALQACRPLAAGFGLETAMTMDLVRLGFRVGEVPVEMSHRATGRGAAGFLHRAGQGVDILRAAAPRIAGLR
jgi:hypothetical protein